MNRAEYLAALKQDLAWLDKQLCAPERQHLETIVRRLLGNENEDYRRPIVGPMPSDPRHEPQTPTIGDTRPAAGPQSIEESISPRLAKCGHIAYRNHDDLCIQDDCPHAAYRNPTDP